MAGSIWDPPFSGSGGGSDTYTNLTPTPSALGGIATGSTFVAQNIQQMFD